MWLGGAALAMWPVYLTVVGIQDLPSTGMGGFVLLYVPLVLIVTVILWTPAAMLAMKSRQKRATEVFAIGACFSQAMSFGLAWMFDITNRHGPLQLTVVAVIFLGTPLVVLGIQEYLRKDSRQRFSGPIKQPRCVKSASVGEGL